MNLQIQSKYFLFEILRKIINKYFKITIKKKYLQRKNI